MENNITVKKGKSYICIEDWKKLGTSFTKGKIYVCHKDRCMYDDFGAEKASVGKLFRLATKEELKRSTSQYIITFFFFQNIYIKDLAMSNFFRIFARKEKKL